MIKLDHVSKKYEMGAVTVTALNDVSLRVDAGEFVVVLGPSGSSKTTLLNMVSALDVPTEGKIIVADQDITVLAHISCNQKIIRNRILSRVGIAE